MGTTHGTLTAEDLEALHKECSFTTHQLRKLHVRFLHLDKDNKGYLQLKDLQLIPELSLNPLGARIIHSFFEVKGGPHCKEMNFRQFVDTLAIFQHIKKNTPADERERLYDAKVNFIFKCYDVSYSNTITTDDMNKVLTMMIGNHVSPEQTKAIADKTMIEADVDRDGVISYDEFKKALHSIDLDAKMTIRFAV